MIKIGKKFLVVLVTTIVAPVLPTGLYGVTLGQIKRRSPMPRCIEKIKYKYVPVGDLRNTLYKSNSDYDKQTRSLKKDFFDTWAKLFPKRRRRKSSKAFAARKKILKTYFCKTHTIFGRKARLFSFDHHPRHNYVQKFHTYIVKQAKSKLDKISSKGKIDPNKPAKLNKFIKKYLDTYYTINVTGKAAASHLQALTNMVNSVLRIVMPKDTESNNCIAGAKKTVNDIKSTISEYADFADTYNQSFEYLIKKSKDGSCSYMGFDLSKILEKIQFLERIQKKMGARIEEVKKQTKNLKALAKRVGSKL